MQAVIVPTGVAAAIPVESSHRTDRAGDQIPTQNILRHASYDNGAGIRVPTNLPPRGFPVPQNLELQSVLDAWLTPPKPGAPIDMTFGGRLPEPSRHELRLPEIPLATLPPHDNHPAWNAGGHAVGYRWGDGPTVLLVHGWGGSAASFALWIPALLKAGFAVAAVDGPAHGGSPGTFASAPAIAGAIRAFGRSYGPFQAVVAHSVGAIATALAGADGESFQRAVFLAPCCSVAHSLFAEARRQGLPPDRDPALWDCFLESFGGDGSLGAAVDRWQRKPALLVHHDPDDDATPYGETVELCRGWEGSRLVDAPGSGHFKILVARRVLAQSIEFLAASTEEMS